MDKKLFEYIYYDGEVLTPQVLSGCVNFFEFFGGGTDSVCGTAFGFSESEMQPYRWDQNDDQAAAEGKEMAVDSEAYDPDNWTPPVPSESFTMPASPLDFSKKLSEQIADFNQRVGPKVDGAFDATFAAMDVVESLGDLDEAPKAAAVGARSVVDGIGKAHAGLQKFGAGAQTLSEWAQWLAGGDGDEEAPDTADASEQEAPARLADHEANPELRDVELGKSGTLSPVFEANRIPMPEPRPEPEMPMPVPKPAQADVAVSAGNGATGSMKMEV